MSNRTQQQGRSYYTEHDFVYVPTEAAKVDDVRKNIDWQRKLLWATRVGDATFERLTAKKPDAPTLTLNVKAPHFSDDVDERVQVVRYGQDTTWSISGQVLNFDSSFTYSPCTVTFNGKSYFAALDSTGAFTFTHNDDTSVSMTDNKIAVECRVDIVCTTPGTGEICEIITGESVTSTVEFIVQANAPVVDIAVDDGAVVEIDSATIADKPNVGATIKLTADPKVQIKDIAVSVNGTNVPVSIPTLSDDNRPSPVIIPLNIARSLFVAGQNAILCNVTVFNPQWGGDDTVASGQDNEMVTGYFPIVAPTFSDLKFTPNPVTDWEGLTGVEFTGTVAVDKNNTAGSAVLKVDGRSYTITKTPKSAAEGSTVNEFTLSATIPVNDLVVGSVDGLVELDVANDLGSDTFEGQPVTLVVERPENILWADLKADVNPVYLGTKNGQPQTERTLTYRGEIRYDSKFINAIKSTEISVNGTILDPQPEVTASSGTVENGQAVHTYSFDILASQISLENSDADTVDIAIKVAGAAIDAGADETFTAENKTLVMMQVQPPVVEIIDAPAAINSDDIQGSITGTVSFSPNISMVDDNQVIVLNSITELQTTVKLTNPVKTFDGAATGKPDVWKADFVVPLSRNPELFEIGKNEITVKTSATFDGLTLASNEAEVEIELADKKLPPSSEYSSPSIKAGPAAVALPGEMPVIYPGVKEGLYARTHSVKLPTPPVTTENGPLKHCMWLDFKAPKDDFKNVSRIEVYVDGKIAFRYIETTEEPNPFYASIGKFGGVWTQPDNSLTVVIEELAGNDVWITYPSAEVRAVIYFKHTDVNVAGEVETLKTETVLAPAPKLTTGTATLSESEISLIPSDDGIVDSVLNFEIQIPDNTDDIASRQRYTMDWYDFDSLTDSKTLVLIDEANQEFDLDRQFLVVDSIDVDSRKITGHMDINAARLGLSTAQKTGVFKFGFRGVLRSNQPTDLTRDDLSAPARFTDIQIRFDMATPLTVVHEEVPPATAAVSTQLNASGEPYYTVDDSIVFNGVLRFDKSETLQIKSLSLQANGGELIPITASVTSSADNQTHTFSQSLQHGDFSTVTPTATQYDAVLVVQFTNPQTGRIYQSMYSDPAMFYIVVPPTVPEATSVDLNRTTIVKGDATQDLVVTANMPALTPVEGSAWAKYVNVKVVHAGETYVGSPVEGEAIKLTVTIPNAAFAEVGEVNMMMSYQTSESGVLSTAVGSAAFTVTVEEAAESTP